MAKTRRAMKVKQLPVIENDDSNDVYEVEKILDKKNSTKGLEYYVKWKGYPAASNTWEPAENILQQKLIKDFEQRQAGPAKRGPTKKVREPQNEEAEEEDGEDAAGEAEDQDDEELENSDVEEEEEEEGEEEDEGEIEEEYEPVKAKRARTASKAAPKKTIAPKSKAQPKTLLVQAPEPEPAKTVVKVKMASRAKRAVEPKAKRVVEPKATKPPAQAKPKATPSEPKKAPSRRNIPLKRLPASAVKDTSIVKPQDEGKLKVDDQIDLSDSPAGDEESATINSVHEEIEFANLKIVRRLNESVHSKKITLLGNYKGDNAVIVLEKTVFEEDAIKEALSLNDIVTKKDFHNDIYSSYQIKPSDSSSSLNNIKAIVVCPADEFVLAKYTRDEAILFSESPDIYSKVVEPFIDGIINSEAVPHAWIYNILDGTSEADRVIINDPDPDSGFILAPDLKWAGDVKNLHITAICHRRDLRSLRDLTDKHLILLNNILTKGTKAIKDKFKNIQGQLRSFIHYQPSFYHFHVHFRVVDASEYQSSDRDHLLGTVINNITLKKDYYKKSTLVYPLSQSHALYRELEKAKRI